MTFQLGEDGVDIYERVIVPLWFEHWAEALMRLAKLKPGNNVLDVACGTGVVTRLAKKIVGPNGGVSGLDMNASMLSRAKSLAEDLDIKWIESDVCASGLGEAQYDVILSQQGYQYFPDKQRALDELYRLLTPEGRLIFSVWDGQSVYTKAVCNAVEKYISIEAAHIQRRQRETPPPSDLKSGLRAAGFTDIKIERQELMIEIPLAPEFVPLHLGSMPIGDKFSALSAVAKKQFINEVEVSMASYVRETKVIYPDAVNVAVGLKA